METSRKIKVELLKPNMAIDAYGNRGHWTLIYNQGFEITVNQRVYFAFSHYTQVSQRCLDLFPIHHKLFLFSNFQLQNGSEVVSYCDRTLVGWSHDVIGHNWACFKGKNSRRVEAKTHAVETVGNQKGVHQDDLSLIEKIHSKQKSWKAQSYSWMEGVSTRTYF